MNQEACLVQQLYLFCLKLKTLTFGKILNVLLATFVDLFTCNIKKRRQSCVKNKKLSFKLKLVVQNPPQQIKKIYS